MRFFIPLTLFIGGSLVAQSYMSDLSPYFQSQSLRRDTVAYGLEADLGGQSRKFTVNIEKRLNGSTSFCTGVLIHPEVVLTSAHCAIREKESQAAGEIIYYTEFKIHFGRNKQDPNYHSIIATEAQANPDYQLIDEYYFRTAGLSDLDIGAEFLGDKELYELDQEYLSKVSELRVMVPDTDPVKRNVMHDTSLIFLPKPAQAPFKPVDILSQDEFPIKLFTELVVVGFGPTKLAPTLEELRAHYQNPPLTFGEYILEGVLFTPEDRKLHVLSSFPRKESFSCYGDSGGPLLYKKNGQYKLAGITSIVSNKCIGVLYGVFLAPSTHWFERVMKKRKIIGGVRL